MPGAGASWAAGACARGGMTGSPGARGAAWAGACGRGAAGVMPGGVGARTVIPGGVAGAAAAGPGIATPSRSGRRRSIWISLSRKFGTARAVGWEAAAQVGQSPTGGSGAPHFRHLDNGSSRMEKAVAA
jgi:hypothetical protein